MQVVTGKEELSSEETNCGANSISSYFYLLEDKNANEEQLKSTDGQDATEAIFSMMEASKKLYDEDKSIPSTEVPLSLKTDILNGIVFLYKLRCRIIS